MGHAGKEDGATVGEQLALIQSENAADSGKAETCSHSHPRRVYNHGFGGMKHEQGPARCWAPKDSRREEGTWSLERLDNQGLVVNCDTHETQRGRDELNPAQSPGLPVYLHPLLSLTEARKSFCLVDPRH